MSSGEYYISQTKLVTGSDWLTSCSPIHTEPLHWWVLLILCSQGDTAHPHHFCENLEGLQTNPLTCLAGSAIGKECLPWSVHPPPRRKSGQSVNRLLLSPLQVEVEKKQSSVRALVDIDCTDIVLYLNYPGSFAVLSVILVLKIRWLRGS